MRTCNHLHPLSTIVFSNSSQTLKVIPVYAYLETFQNNAIHENTAGRGGGIYIGDSSNPTFCNVLINNNTADGDGGGIYCGNPGDQYFSSPKFISSTIHHNSAGGDGGGIYIISADAIFDPDAKSNIFMNQGVSAI